MTKVHKKIGNAHKHVKKHFIKMLVPHEHNDFHPHLFRKTSVTFILGLAVFLLGISFGNSIFLSKTVLGVNIATDVLIDMANVNRQANNADPLVKNEKLERAAALKVDDMIENKYFAHFSPDGVSPWYFIQQSGYDFLYAGENLAINFNESKQVNDAWMNSQLHKDNLLNNNFKEVGLAAKEGEYNGVNTVYVVQMFGAPKEKEEKVKTYLVNKFENNNLAHNEVEKKTEVNAKINNSVKIIQKTNNAVVAKKMPPAEVESLKNNDVWGEVVKTEKLNDNLGNNLASNDDTGKVAGVAKYADIWENAIFNSSYYIEIALLVLCVLVLLGILFRVFIEFHRQHYKHVLYAMLFFLVLLALAFINLQFLPWF
jgi:hypothetical protein